VTHPSLSPPARCHDLAERICPAVSSQTQIWMLPATDGI